MSHLPAQFLTLITASGLLDDIQRNIWRNGHSSSIWQYRLFHGPSRARAL